MKRRWVKAAAGALALLILGVALAPTLMPTGWIRERIAEESRKALGAPVTVEGISLGWLSGVTLEGIEVPNAEGYSDRPLARISRVHADPDLRDLLSGKVHLRSVEVSGVELSLERRESDGAWNAQALVPAPAPDAPAPSAPPPAVRLDAFTVEGKASGTLPATFRIEGTAPSLSDQPVKARVVAGLPGWELKADVLASPGGDLTVEGDLEGQGLKALLAPFTALAADLGPTRMHVTASLKGSDLKAGIRDASLQGLQAGAFGAAAGTFTLTAEGTLPALKARLETALSKVSIPGPRGPAEVDALKLGTTVYVEGDRLRIGECVLDLGGLRTELSGERAAGTLRLSQTFEGDLEAFGKCTRGLLPEGASFTGRLGGKLDLQDAGEGLEVSGNQSLQGFSVRSEGMREPPRLDLLLQEKLKVHPERLEIESLRLSGPEEGKGPLSLALAGVVEDPANLGRLDLEAEFHADLERLLAVVRGYFSQTPDLACQGVADGRGVLRGSQGQASLKGTLSLASGRFSGGFFGKSPLDLPQARADVDLDLSREGGTRVLVRSLRVQTPYLTAGATEGLLTLPAGALSARFEAEIKDLDAAARLLKGPVEALRPYALAGQGTLKGQVSGTLSEPRFEVDTSWKGLSASGGALPSVSASALSLKTSGGLGSDGALSLGAGSLRLSELRAAQAPLPGPLGIPELSVDWTSLRGTSLQGLKVASLPVSYEGDLEAGGRIRAKGRLTLDLPWAARLARDWKLGDLPPLLGKLTVEDLEAEADPVAHAASVRGRFRASESGLASLELNSLRIADWVSLSGIELEGFFLEADLSKAPGLPVPAQGPASLRIPKASGSLERGLAFALTLDATRASIDRKPAGDVLTADLAGVLTRDAVTLDRGDLMAGPLRIPLQKGSVLPLSSKGQAKVRLSRTRIELPAIARWLPQLKDLAGAVEVEGSLEGAFGDLPGLKPDLKVRLDQVALSYKAADGKPVPVQASGSLSLTRERLVAEALTLAVGGESLSVKGEVLDPLRIPSGRLEIQGGAFDLDRLLAFQPAASAPSSGGAASPGSARGKEAVLPEAFRKADLAFALRLKELVWKKNRLQELDITATLQKAVLDAKVLAKVNEGPVEISLKVDGGRPVPDYRMVLKASDVGIDVNMPEVKFILPILAGGEVKGKVTLEPLELTAQGATWEALLASLRTVQDGHLIVSHGEVKGAGFFKVIGDVLRNPALSDVRFDGIDCRFRVGDRQVLNLGTELRSNAGSVRSTGWVNFDQGMEQKAVLSGGFLKTGYGEKGDRAMEAVMGRGGIRIHGTLSDPKTDLDMEAVMKEVLKEAAGELLKKGLEDWLKKR